MRIERCDQRNRSDDERWESHDFCATEDEGPGIPAEIRDQVFNLYFTTKKTGSGIGLAMAYRIMQLHAGSITIESEGGKGSRCHLALPSRESKEAAA